MQNGKFVETQLVELNINSLSVVNMQGGLSTSNCENFTCNMAKHVLTVINSMDVTKQIALDNKIFNKIL